MITGKFIYEHIISSITAVNFRKFYRTLQNPLKIEQCLHFEYCVCIFSGHSLKKDTGAST